MYGYKAFGLHIQSDLEIPEFLPSTEDPDVRILIGRVAIPSYPAGLSVRIIKTVGSGILLHWSGVASFLIEGGERITVDPVPGVDEQVVRVVVSGPVIGVLLAMRGGPVFHASVVWCPSSGSAIAFAGRKGEGKSTMASAMHNAGYHMMSDDIMPGSIREDGEIFVDSGFPHTKLWPESANELVESPASLRPIHANSEKRSRVIRERYFAGTARLEAVVVLEEGAAVHGTRLTGVAAVHALLPHWYGALFSGQLLGVLGYERHLRDATALARGTRVFRLVRPRSFDALTSVISEVRTLTADD